MSSTPFATVKEAVLTLIRAKGCTEVGYVSNNAASFADLLPLLREYAKTFDCDADYLRNILLCFDDAILLNAGIYVDKNLSEVTNPTWIVSSTIATVRLFGYPGFLYHEGLEIHRASQVSSVELSGGLSCGSLTISSNSVVDHVSIEAGSTLDVLNLKACGALKGTLTALSGKAGINYTVIDETAIFGSLDCPPTQNNNLP